jgi:hypothetical protein
MFLPKSLVSLSSLAALAVLSSGVPAIAQTNQPDNTVNNQEQQFSELKTAEIQDATIVPVPGTVATTSSMLTAANANSTFPSASTQTVPNNQVAQGNINIGGSTRGGSSYVGVAGNIGLGGGDSALGDGNFAVISKVGFSNSLSVRPSVLFGNDTTFLIPLTYDFNFQPIGDPFSEPLPIAPYIGAGAAIQTGDDSETAFMLTGGVDVPLNNRFTATAVVNAAFFNQTDVGLMVGVGYNFSGF